MSVRIEVRAVAMPTEGRDQLYPIENEGATVGYKIASWGVVEPRNREELFGAAGAAAETVYALIKQLDIHNDIEGTEHSLFGGEPIDNERFDETFPRDIVKAS